MAQAEQKVNKSVLQTRRGRGLGRTDVSPLGWVCREMSLEANLDTLQFKLLFIFELLLEQGKLGRQAGKKKPQQSPL